MTLKDDIDELEARRAALTLKAHDPQLPDEERAAWQARLDDVLAEQQVLANDMKADPLGYLAWHWADSNTEVQQQVLKFKQ